MSETLTPEEILENYKKALARHDWFYHYSDDHRVWKAGEQSWSNICHRQKVLDKDYLIWNQYCPVEFKKNPK